MVKPKILFDSDTSGLESRRWSELPLAVQALGELSWNGTAVPSPSNRVRHLDGVVSIDGHRCFVAYRDETGEPCWLRVPRFFPAATPELWHSGRYLFWSGPECSSSNLLISEHMLLESNDSTRRRVAGPEQIVLHRWPSAEDCLDLEQRIAADCFADAERLLSAQLSGSNDHPRILFAVAALRVKQGRYGLAKRLFHRSARLGHPDGLASEWKVDALLSRPFREQYPAVADSIERGEPLRALTILRAVREQHPLYANILLAHCLRTGGSFLEEGLDASAKALEREPLLSDVYGSRFELLFHSKRDEAAADCAKAHLNLYPFHLRAWTDAIDSALILNRIEDARWYTLGYLTLAENLHTALKHLFKFFEAIGDFDSLAHYYSDIMPTLRAATPETLTQYGEVLLEVGRQEEAIQVLERAFRAAPGQAGVVLAYCRAKARMGKTEAAGRLLETVLHDRARTDHPAERFLLITLLSEVYRSQGRTEDAYQLWPPQSEFTPQLLDVVGPPPFLEYLSCRVELELLDGASPILELLEAGFGELPRVRELREFIRPHPFGWRR